MKEEEEEEEEGRRSDFELLQHSAINILRQTPHTLAAVLCDIITRTQNNDS